MAWWLAPTSRWRTAAMVKSPPDQTCLLQSLQKAKKSRERLVFGL
jgi:hypothetical protein